MMNNRESVMQALNDSLMNQHCGFIENVGNVYAVSEETINDTLELLEEQQAIPVDTKVIGTERGDIEVYCCRACRFQLDPTFHFCPNCGKEVKWNDR